MSVISIETLNFPSLRLNLFRLKTNHPDDVLDQKSDYRETTGTLGFLLNMDVLHHNGKYSPQHL